MRLSQLAAYLYLKELITPLGNPKPLASDRRAASSHSILPTYLNREYSMRREVFESVIEPEIYLDEVNIRTLVEKAVQAPFSFEINEPLVMAKAASSDMQRANKYLRDRLSKVRDNVIRRDIEAGLLRQSAPLAMALGAPLQGLSAPSVFEDPTHLRIMALLADDVGVGHVQAGRIDAFRRLAQNYGVNECAGTQREVGSVRGIHDLMYKTPAVFFALSRRSDIFDLELIGIDLAMRSAGLLSPWLLLSAPAAVDIAKRLDLSIAQGTRAIPNNASPLAFALEIAEECGDGPTSRARVALRPRLAMAALTKDRAREAKVYHENFKLEGRPLSEWFGEAQENPFPLIDVLERSRLIRPGDPDRSMLTGRLVVPNGPMFRIFEQQDIEVINTWIASLVPLPEQEEENEHKEKTLPHIFETQRRNVTSGDLDLGMRPQSLREAYVFLQGRALTPKTREFAREYCDFWLDPSRNSVGKTDRSLPPKWRPGMMREWLLNAHDRQGMEFSKHYDGPLPTREQVVGQTLQLAPLTLIDGAWLQGFTEAFLASTRVGVPLFETYWDELGNGDWEINHPKIYREVLSAMGVELPATGSANFATDNRLDDASFRLPVYWLCLGKFPKTFCPEVLGMNLAMDLSGVGGTYRSARKFLEHYGFLTLFVDLHNTIDNVSTGHSAWAADAIDAHIHATSDYLPIHETWERIRIGYESLSPIVDNDDDLNFFNTAVVFDEVRVRANALVHPPTCLGAPHT